MHSFRKPKVKPSLSIHFFRSGHSLRRLQPAEIEQFSKRVGLQYRRANKENRYLQLRTTASDVNKLSHAESREQRCRVA